MILFKLLNFIKNVVKSILNVLYDFIKEIVVHLPAITILVFAVIGITGTIALLPIEAMFLGIPFITETMVAPVLAVLTTWALATISSVKPIQIS